VIRIVIVADTRLYREGLAQVLGRGTQISVIATAARRDEALARLPALKPDVILVDMAVPDSLSAVRAVVESAADAPVVALGVADDSDDVLGFAEAGVVGYVPREASVDHLVAVIESAARGEAICSPRIAASLLRRVATLAAGQSGGVPQGQLTGREREIVGLIDRGLSNKEIARQLGIEVATVKNHVHNTLEKLKVHRRGEAAARMRGIALPRVSGPAS
jgi:DNA-binding NarL/FixJ family response regulator